MSKLLELRERVRQILTSELSGVVVDEAGDFSIQNESTAVFVRCEEQDFDNGESRTMINVLAPVVFGAPPSPQLFEYLALESNQYLFGHLVGLRNDDGSISVFLEYRLLGDYLDAEELLNAVWAIALSANDLDDEVKSRFGGERLNED